MKFSESLNVCRITFKKDMVKSEYCTIYTINPIYKDKINDVLSGKMKLKELIKYAKSRSGDDNDF